MKTPHPPDDHDLHLYLDGELSPRRRIEVEAWLAKSPEAAAKVRTWRHIGDRLHAHFDPVLNEAPLSSLNPPARSTWRPSRRLALAAALAFAAFGGWWLRGLAPQGRSANPLATDLIQPAAFAHRVYATDRRFPVELAAPRKAVLDAWISERMNTSIQAPDLAALGLGLLGGRLLPSTHERMAAQFMYETADGQRVTLYVRRGDWGQEHSDFRYREAGGVRLFYWTDEHFGYVVTGTLNTNRLMKIARAVHRRLRQD